MFYCRPVGAQCVHTRKRALKPARFKRAHVHCRHTGRHKRLQILATIARVPTARWRHGTGPQCPALAVGAAELALRGKVPANELSTAEQEAPGEVG